MKPLERTCTAKSAAKVEISVNHSNSSQQNNKNVYYLRRRWPSYVVDSTWNKLYRNDTLKVNFKSCSKISSTIFGSNKKNFSMYTFFAGAKFLQQKSMCEWKFYIKLGNSLKNSKNVFFSEELLKVTSKTWFEKCANLAKSASLWTRLRGVL